MSENVSYKTDPMCTDTTETTSHHPPETWGRREADAYMLLLCTVYSLAKGCLKSMSSL